MMPHSPHSAPSCEKALPPAGTSYPGDVPEAMPEGFQSFSLGVYVFETIRRECVDPECDSVFANMPIYYSKSTRRRPVAPDAFVVRGLPHNPQRKSYCLWEPGALAPQVVFEIVSRGSRWKDVVRNRKLYEQLGVQEYYWFDPATEDLVAYELHPVTGRYRKRRPDRHGRYASRLIDLQVGLEQGSLGLFRNGAYIPPSQELLGEKDRVIGELIDEKDRVIDEKDRVIDEKDRVIDEKDRVIGEKDRVIDEKDHAIANLINEQAAVLRPILLQQLAARFGPLPDAIVRAVERPANAGRLALFLAAAQTAASLEQVGIEQQ